MEQLASEVQKLRKQVEVQGRIIAVFVAVAVASLVVPLFFKDDPRQFVAYAPALGRAAGDPLPRLLLVHLSPFLLPRRQAQGKDPINSPFSS